MSDERRRALRGLIEDHLRRYGAESTRVIEVFAKTHQMHPTDFQALVLIMNAQRQGEPATPTALRQALSLTSGAVTGTIDRLVESGHVVRRPDPHDRRQTRLFWEGRAQALAYAFFQPLGARTDAIMDGFDDGDLAVIERFMAAMSAALAAHRGELESQTGSTGSVG